MISKEMEALGKAPSKIRELFEYGRKKAAEIGSENVFDFSIGNPTVPAPAIVNETIEQLLKETDPVALHGYTSAVGDEELRQTLAAQMNRDYNAGVDASNFYITCGAAASLTITIKALCEPGDEFVTCAPFFPEYKVFTENAGAKFVMVPADISSFQIDFEKLEAALNEHTKAIILNSPNNPAGTVYSEETVKKLAELLEKKSKEFGRPIFIISDEPYRVLVYGDIKLPYIPAFYDNTIICYSYSKSISLPGERIGYILVPGSVERSGDVYAAVAGAGRSLGYVCAPSLMQKVVARCNDATTDLKFYEESRDIIYNALVEYGYTVVKPDGAFYIFPQTPIPDATEFAEKAKEFNILVVPGDGFGCPGHVRLFYAIPRDMLLRSLPKFKELAEYYGLKPAK